MEVYQKTEAYKIRESFRKYIGLKFLYDHSMYEVLNTISIKESFSEDTFCVEFVFRNGVCLSPLTFTGINRLIFVYCPAERMEFASGSA